MFDFFCESGADEVLLDEGMILDDTLLLCPKEVQLLDKVHVVLVELLILVDIHEESPVVKVVDGIFEDGIGGSIAPEAATEPGGEQLQWFVRGIIRRSI